MNGIEILDLIGRYAGTAVTTFVAGGAGAFVTSYLNEKGKNLATHEDIDKVLDQVRAVTMVTKEIEAKISDDVWARQRRWELRRDIMLQAMDELTNTQGPLSALTAAAMSLETATDEGRKISAVEKMTAAYDAIGLALPGLFKSVYRIQLVCGPDVQQKYLKVQELMFTVHHQIANNKASEAVRMIKYVGHATEAAQAAIRHELGMDEPNPIVTTVSGG